jgi:hypothetical protein
MLHRTAIGFVLALTAARSSAQTVAPDSADGARGGWLFGASAGVPGYESQFLAELFTVGINVTHAQPSRLGMDFSIGTMPRVRSRPCTSRRGARAPCGSNRSRYSTT